MSLADAVGSDWPSPGFGVFRFGTRVTSGMIEAANSNLALLYFCKLKLLFPFGVNNTTSYPKNNNEEKRKVRIRPVTGHYCLSVAAIEVIRLLWSLLLSS